MATPEPAPRNRFTFAMPLRVRWAEVDPQGVVFNPHYFAYADVAFTEYLREVGFPYPQGLHALGCDLYAVRAEGNFRASARYDDVLELTLRAARLGTSSVRFDMHAYRADELLFEAALVYVNASLDTRKSTPLPGTFTQCILAYERVPPER